MRAGSRDDMMIALRLDRCKSLLMVPSCCDLPLRQSRPRRASCGSSHFRYAPKATAGRQNAPRREGAKLGHLAGDAVGTPITERPPHRTVRAAFPHTACMGLSLSRVHHATFCRAVASFFCSTRAASILPSRPHITIAVARSDGQGRRFLSAAEGLSLTDASTAAGLYGAFLVKGASRHFLSCCCFILLFDPRREHSSVPTAYYHRRRAQRRSRTALLQRRRRLVLDRREHGGRLPAIGWLGRAMIRGEPAIGHEQSRANHACIRLNPYRVPTMKQSYASAGKAPRRRVHSPIGIAAIAVCGLPPPRIVIGYRRIKRSQVPNSVCPFSF